MKILFCVLFIVLLVSCNNSGEVANQKSDSLRTTQSDAMPIDDVTGCYQKVAQRDTFLIQLNQYGDSVSGTMHFDNYQKDSSKGMVRGSIQNDIVVLWYDFFSEGMHSVMEIVLKKTESGLVRAFGPMETRGDTAAFKNHSELKFDEQQTFLKIECGNQAR